MVKYLSDLNDLLMATLITDSCTLIQLLQYSEELKLFLKNDTHSSLVSMLIIRDVFFPG